MNIQKIYLPRSYAQYLSAFNTAIKLIFFFSMLIFWNSLAYTTTQTDREDSTLLNSNMDRDLSQDCEDKVTEQSVTVFEYADLKKDTEKMIKQFHEEGFIAVRGIPGYEDAYEAFLNQARLFIKLSEEEKSKCSVEKYKLQGWSSGKETFNGLQDLSKSFYYALITGNDCENVWPDESLTGFKPAYLNLGKIITDTGLKILPLLGLDVNIPSTLGRMLHYSPVYETDADESPYWCGVHTGHGFMSGLCAATYIKGDEIVQKPENCGLYVRDKSVSIPRDALIFQISEVAELLSNGLLTATEHYVKKAFGGVERFTFALFFSPEKNFKMHSKLTKFEDRFKDGMTFEEWEEASTKKYF